MDAHDDIKAMEAAAKAANKIKDNDGKTVT